MSATLSRLLRHAGGAPPATDFAAYLREITL